MYHPTNYTIIMTINIMQQFWMDCLTPFFYYVSYYINMNVNMLIISLLLFNTRNWEKDQSSISDIC